MIVRQSEALLLDSWFGHSNMETLNFPSNFPIPLPGDGGDAGDGTELSALHHHIYIRPSTPGFSLSTSRLTSQRKSLAKSFYLSNSHGS